MIIFKHLKMTYFRKIYFSFSTQ